MPKGEEALQSPGANSTTPGSMARSSTPHMRRRTRGVRLVAGSPSPHLESASTVREYVAEQLRGGILVGDVSGGARLVQADVAALLDVSVTPVREAFRDLATEGLVSIDPRRGAMVRRITYDELVELYRLRRVLEPDALARAAQRIEDSTLQHAETILSEMEVGGLPGRFADSNRHFETSLLRDLPSFHETDILTRLHNRASMFVGLEVRFRPDTRGPIISRNQALLAALRARDGARVARVSRHSLGLRLRSLRESRHLLVG